MKRGFSGEMAKFEGMKIRYRYDREGKKGDTIDILIREEQVHHAEEYGQLIRTSKTMPRWLSRHSVRFVIERSLVQIQPGAYLEDSIKQQKLLKSCWQ